MAFERGQVEQRGTEACVERIQCGHRWEWRGNKGAEGAWRGNGSVYRVYRGG